MIFNAILVFIALYSVAAAFIYEILRRSNNIPAAKVGKYILMGGPLIWVWYIFTIFLLAIFWRKD